MNYPAGAFQELMRIDQQANRFIKAHALASEHYAEEMRDCAKQDKPVTWIDDMNRDHNTKPADFVIENMPDELLAQAVKAWLSGDKQASANFFESACEVGFERAVEFLADVSAERAE